MCKSCLDHIKAASDNPECPSCRCPLAFTARCLLAETMLEDVEVTCDLGCGAKTKVGGYLHHRTVCDCRNFKCPIFACDWEGNHTKFKEHMEASHKATVKRDIIPLGANKYPLMLTLEGANKKKEGGRQIHWTALYRIEDKGYLLVQMMKGDISGSVSVRLVGPEALRKKVTALILLPLHAKSDVKRMSLEVTPMSVHGGQPDIYKDPCLVFPVHCLTQRAPGDKDAVHLMVDVTIEK